MDDPSLLSQWGPTGAGGAAATAVIAGLRNVAGTLKRALTSLEQMNRAQARAEAQSRAQTALALLNARALPDKSQQVDEIAAQLGRDLANVE